MAAIQAGARSGEEISSTAHLSPLHSITAGLPPSYSHPAIGRKSGTNSEWSLCRMLPPPPQQQSFVSSTCVDANSSRVYPPALETHQLSQLRTESGSGSLNIHHPNKRRRLSGTILTPSQCHPLGSADSPEPHARSDRSGHEPSSRPDLTTTDSLIKLLSDPANHVAAHSPHFGRQDWPQHAAYAPNARRESQCCRRACQGPQCSTIRKVARELITEIDARFPGSANAVDPHAHRIREIPDIAEVGVAEALEWALNRLRCVNPPLKNYHFANRDPAATEQQINLDRLSPKSPLLPAMKRLSDPGQPDQIPYPTTVRRSPLQGLGPFPGVSAPEERWAHLDPAEPPVPSVANQPTASLPTGGPFNNESPPNASQSAIMLPSPTSLNLPAPPSSHPSISSPTSYPPSAAHVAHLQDLQHQVSVKTLALQTLQREYDNLLHKLERMRTKCATLEKKFEVSDAEINSLTDEKERLEKQVDSLEKLLEEAQNARDEARSTSSEQASQYMKIIKMAGQLQAQASEERKKWETEKARMLAKLAESQAREDDMGDSASSHPLDSPTNSRVDIESDDKVSSSCAALPIGKTVESSTKASFSERSLASEPVPGRVDILLQREIKRLEARVQSLEIALRAAQDESKIVREAAFTLTGVGQRIESTVEKAMTAKE